MKKILLALFVCAGYSLGMLHEFNSYDDLRRGLGVSSMCYDIPITVETIEYTDDSGVPIWLSNIKEMNDDGVADFLAYICELDIDLNASDEDGDALVHILARRNLPDALKVLLSCAENKSLPRARKFQIDKWNFMRETALDLAVMYKGEDARSTQRQLQSVKLLLSHGAQINLNNILHGTPLHYAIWHSNFAPNDISQFCIVNLLTKVPGVDVNAINKYGETPLSIAVYWGNIAAIDALLRTNKVDFEILGEDNETVLQQAARGRNRKVFRMLKRHVN